MKKAKSRVTHRSSASAPKTVKSEPDPIVSQPDQLITANILDAILGFPLDYLSPPWAPATGFPNSVRVGDKSLLYDRTAILAWLRSKRGWREYLEALDTWRIDGGPDTIVLPASRKALH